MTTGFKDVLVSDGVWKRVPAPACKGCLGLEDVGHELLPGVWDPLPTVYQTRPAGWAAGVKSQHVAAFHSLLGRTFPSPEKCEDEGVLYVGGGKYWPMIVAGVKMFRKHSDLPVQVWHRGGHEPVDPRDLESCGGVTYHDSSAVDPKPRRLGGWEAKGVAMLHCGWERFLYLDADAYCVSDPASLLHAVTPDCPFAYWLDMPTHDDCVNWESVGLARAKGLKVPCVQGGQVAIHRGAAWRTLVLYHWLNQHSEYTYNASKLGYHGVTGYGDQDMLRVAIAASGANVRSLGRAPWNMPAFVCEINYKPCVVHRCQGKAWADSRDKVTRHLPGDAEFWALVKEYQCGDGSARDVFDRVYKRGLWGHGDQSGGGSTPHEAKPYLDLINGLIKVGGWQSVVDLGCGDGFITTKLQAAQVSAADCYGPHLERLSIECPQVNWYDADLDADRTALPAGDVALLKDVLQHWPDALVRDWVKWARRCGKWKWVVITNDHLQQHPDPALGGYRGLDQNMEPLKSLDLYKIASYLHKTVMLLECG